MSHKSSGLWCDLCGKPILDDPWWHCSVNGKPGHSCDNCKKGWDLFKDDKTETPAVENEPGGKVLK